MTTALNKTADGTIEITINIPWSDVQKIYKQKVDEFIKLVEIKGFRKGKAPKNLAEKKLDKNQIYQEVIKEIIPKTYSEVLKEHKINPIVQPEIKLVKAEEGKDWQFKAKTCEKPKVNLVNYKKSLKKVDIWVPGKVGSTRGGQAKPLAEKSKEQKKQEKLNNILEDLIKNVKITIPNILIEIELNRRLSNLLDEVQKLGLTIDKYLQTKGKTIEQLRSEYSHEIEKSYKLEFILEEIADKEKIIIEDKDIDNIIAKAKDKQEKKVYETQRYYLASMLRRQKTLDKLLSL